MSTWPDDLFQFAYLRDWNEELKNLAEEAEDEDWGYHLYVLELNLTVR